MIRYDTTCTSLALFLMFDLGMRQKAKRAARNKTVAECQLVLESTLREDSMDVMAVFLTEPLLWSLQLVVYA